VTPTEQNWTFVGALRAVEAFNPPAQPILSEAHYAVEQTKVLLSYYKGHNNSYYAYKNDHENEEIVSGIVIA